MWKNKHVIIALLVAPVLALVAWFAIDRMVAEVPHAAVPGAVYELVARPSCRYPGGRCELVNGDFRLELKIDADGALSLGASHALDAVQVAIGGVASKFGPPRALVAVDAHGTAWRVPLDGVSAAGSLRLLADAGGSQYYAETSLAFVGGR